MLEADVAERDEKGRLKKGVVLNPKGREKGKPNKFTADIKAMVEEALHRAGENAQKRDKRKKDLSAGAAYLLEQAEENPQLFMPLLRQLLPAKLDLDVTVLNRDMVSLLSQRREQLAQLKDVTPPDEDDD